MKQRDSKKFFVEVITYFLVSMLFFSTTGCVTDHSWIHDQETSQASVVPNAQVNDSIPYHEAMARTTGLPSENLSRTGYYTRLAKNYFEQGHFPEAIDHFRAALAHLPGNHDAHIGLIHSYVTSGQDTLALLEIDKFIIESNQAAAEEQVFEWRVGLNIKAGLIANAVQLLEVRYVQTKQINLLRQIFNLHLEGKDFTGANLVLERLTKAGEDPYALSMAKAEIFIATKDYENALASLELAEGRKPLDETALTKKVLVLQELERWSEVLEQSRKTAKFQARTTGISEVIVKAALRLNDFESALEELTLQGSFGDKSDRNKLKVAYLHYRLKNYASAEKTYAAIKETGDQSDRAEVHYFLAQIFFETGREPDARRALNQIDDGSTFFVSAQLRLAEHDFQEGREAEGAARLDRIYVTRPISAQAYVAYAEYFIATAQYASAINVLTEGTKHVLESDALIIRRAYCYFQLDDEAAFKEHLSTFMTPLQNRGEVYEMLARLWHARSLSPAEIESFTLEALRLGQRSGALFKIVGWILFERGQYDQALALWELRFEQSPFDAEAAEALTKIYAAINIQTKADEFSRISLELRQRQRVGNIFENVKAEDARWPASLK